MYDITTQFKFQESLVEKGETIIALNLFPRF